jgi:hypothetical protein
MGDENPLLFQPAFPTLRVDFDVHPELLRKEGTEEEIMVPLKIFYSNALKVELLQSFQDRKIFGEREGFSETEEEFEKVSQDHQMAHPPLFRVQEPEENFHLLRLTPCEMGIGNKDPIFFATTQYSSCFFLTLLKSGQIFLQGL